MSDLFTILKNAVTMLEVRGYIIPDKIKNIVNKDLDNFLNKYSMDFIRENPNKIQDIMMDPDIAKNKLRPMLSYYFKHTNSKDKCLLYFAELEGGKQVPKEETKNFSKIFHELECNTGIMVVPSDLSSGAKKDLESLQSTRNYIVQVFLDQDLLYNPTVSNFSAKIEKILTPEEEIAFFKRTRILKNQMPKWATEGPIAKYFGLKHGTVVKLKRKSIVEGSYINEDFIYKVVQKKTLDKQKPKKLKQLPTININKDF